MAIIQEKNKNKWTKDGRSWYFDTYYTNEFGEKKEKKSKLFKLKREAEDAERKFLDNIENNNFSQNLKISFKQAYHDWLEFKRAELKETTFFYTKTILNKWIYQEFVNYEDIRKIDEIAINKWKNEFSSKEIKLQYKNKIISYFKEFLRFCYDNYDLKKKVYTKVQPYKISVSSKKNDAEWNFWTYEEFKTFIENVDNSYHKMIFEFLYYTGLRLGELIALKWENINLEKKYFKVEYSFTNSIEDKAFAFVDPKTKNSIRTVEIDDDLTNLLKKHYIEESQLYGFNNDYLVFGNIKHISPTTFRRWLNKYIDKTNVKKITPHGFRHSHVSLLINLGCDSRDVAERIGDTVEVVEKTYYHMFPEKKTIPVNKLNDLKIRGNYEVNDIQKTKKAESSAKIT